MRRAIFLCLVILAGAACQRQPVTGQPPQTSRPAEAKTDISVRRSAEPVPQLVAEGSETNEVRGERFVRYNLRIVNYAAYPDELFAPAPSLPPCGLNANSSRTWVEIYAGNARRLYGFCALTLSEQLASLSFSVREGQAPPQTVYVVMMDRARNVIYRSNEVRISPAN
jgi:hypothetical protein